MKKVLLTLCLLPLFATAQMNITKVKEINDFEDDGGLPNNLFTFGDKIYFGADDSSGSNSPGNADLGRELWVTDGTEAGTTLVKDLRPGDGSSSPNFFFSLGDNLFFSANTGSGNVLFTSDGTEVGTIATGAPFIFNPLELDGSVYFVLTSDSNKLYEFDGTQVSPVANAGSGTASLVGANFTSLNGKIYAYMDYSEDEPTVGRELYEYDPATDIFTLVKDITGDAEDSKIANFVVVGSEIYFEADGALWKSDGTTAGTVAVGALAGVDASNLFSWDGKVFFEGDNGTDDDQLYSYNPNGEMVTNVSNITGGDDNNHDPSDFVVLDGFMYYAGEVADDSSSWLFRTDGTTTTRLDNNIKDIDDLAVLNGKIYFEGDDGVTGNELYSLDPANLSTEEAQTEIIKIFPNPATDFLVVPNKLLQATYSIYDMGGKQIKSGVITATKVDIDLTAGMYLFEVAYDKGSITKKILVK
ncbi:MAG: T9SS type A sorting domain-containing protein [Leeuwenhoekiella sp.]